MQITTEKRIISGTNMRGSRAFTVKVGAHIMKVLSGLYTNPIDAMVREYLTNMFDAVSALKRKHPNVEAPTGIIRVPNVLSHELVFEDFGIGMSFDTVWEVFAQYGESTKNDSNDEVGGFGLGSKAAFCYNDGAAWTIESRFNGEKHAFTAYVGEDNIPNLSHVGSVPTKEHSGVTIRIPILRDDVYAVQEAVEKYYPFFSLPLKLEGLEVPPPIDYIFRKPSWGIAKDDAHGQHTAIMGNVPYNFRTNQLGEWKTWVPQDMQDLFEQNNVHFYLPIGSAEVVPSRDALKFSPRTLLTLKNAFKEVAKELPTVIAEQIKTAKTEWEAMTMIGNITDVSYSFGEVKWNGTAMNHREGIVRTIADLNKLDPTAQISQYGLTDEWNSAINPLMVLHKSGPNMGKPITPETPVKTMAMHPTKNTYLIINNVTVGGVGIMRAFLKSRLVKIGYGGRVSRHGRHTKGRGILLSTKLTAAEISAFFGGMPESHILWASDFKSQTNTGSSTSPKKTYKSSMVYRLNDTKTAWEAGVLPPTGQDIKYYLPLTQQNGEGKWVFERSYTRLETSRMALLCRLARSFELNIDDVYGIREKQIKNFDPAIWKRLDHAIDAELKDTINKNSDSVMAPTDLLDECETKTISKMLALITEAAWAKEPLLKTVKAEIDKLQKANTIKDKKIVAARKFAQDNPQDALIKSFSYSVNVQSLFDDVMNTYPLFAMHRDLETFRWSNASQSHLKKYAPYYLTKATP